MSVEFVFEGAENDTIRQRISQHVTGIPGDTGTPFPENDADGAKYKFFEKGRDLESAYVNHKYTDKEKAILKQYESVNYLPPHSKCYRDWIARQPSRTDWDRWILMGVIGFSVGVLGFLLHQFIEILSHWKWDRARKMIDNHQFLYAWLWVVSFSMLCVFISASSVVVFRPSAGGSGLPEIIAYLNGTLVRHIFNVKTFVVKFFSCMFAVAGGMPAGPEAPMVHLGALVAAGISQLRSSTLGFRLPFFTRFRNSEDRRNFISAGAGVASAFGAPVGGLLFSMEEVSSFWNMKLSWQTFFCCMVATFTTDLFNSAFSAFHYDGNFGLFRAEKYIHFQVKEGIALNIIALVPTIILGIIGGMTGALFTFMNLKFARLRKNIMSLIKSDYVRKLALIVEPCILMMIMATLSVFLPAAVQCSPYLCDWKYSTNSSCHIGPSLYNERSVEHYSCPNDDITVVNGTKYINGSYNQVATLLFLTGEKAIHHLFSRDTHLQFDYGPLLTVLPCYFLLACWSAGTPISSGVVVPQLFIGALLGRLVGIAMVSLFGVQSSSYWDWMDPGAFALLGAASFFGGVSRLTMSLTVIMVELTNDIQFLLLIMVVIMVSKWVGDFFTHAFYHSQLEFKCIPFLDAEPVITYDGQRRLNLEEFFASHVMTAPVVTLQTRERVSHLARLLLETTHCGFPIVKTSGSNLGGLFCGIITRDELNVLLCHREAFQQRSDAEFDDLLNIDFGQFADEDIMKLSQSKSFKSILRKLTAETYSSCWIDLIPYANQSAPSVYDDFSLHRTYMIFRSLGLRHLTVVNRANQVVGMITRKDLMGFSIEEKIDGLLTRQVASNSLHDSS